MIKSKSLKKFKKVKHGFFNRNCGKSKGIYKSLNCGIGSSDSKRKVLENLKIVCKKIGIPDKKLILLNQKHTNKFHFIDKSYNLKKKRGDALITNIKKIGIGVLTADCAPILVYDKKKKFISAIHAGWKGAYKGIINKVIRFMMKKGCEPKNLVAVIGPCIAQKSYDFSLNKFIYYQLKKLGVNNLEIINKNTFDPKNNFYSARRSIKNKEFDYGRNISVIMIN